ncbi:MAG: HAD family phosphatase [bacterium]|nr:HAD family phosphatase [bacterium]
MTLDAASASALLFDCDGTLVDNTEVYRICWRQIFHRHGFEMSDEWFDQWASHSMEPFLLAAIPNADPALRTKLANEGLELFSSSAHLVRPVEHVVEVARMYKGVTPMAVVSGGPRSEVLLSLQAVGIDSLFDVIVTADDVTRAKPAPDGYLLAARLLGVSPQDCIAYEDSMTGMDSARAAGIATIIDVRAPLAGSGTGSG